MRPGRRQARTTRQLDSERNAPDANVSGWCHGSPIAADALVTEGDGRFTRRRDEQRGAVVEEVGVDGLDAGCLHAPAALAPDTEGVDG